MVSHSVEGCKKRDIREMRPKLEQDGEWTESHF